MRIPVAAADHRPRRRISGPLPPLVLLRSYRLSETDTAPLKLWAWRVSTVDVVDAEGKGLLHYIALYASQKTTEIFGGGLGSLDPEIRSQEGLTANVMHSSAQDGMCSW